METGRVEARAEGPSERKSLSGQVAFDLEAYLRRFPNRSFGIRNLAKAAQLNERTIKRLLDQQNTATYQTLFKLYSIFLGEPRHAELLQRCPEVVASYLLRFNPAENSVAGKDSRDFLAQIRLEPLLAELYVLVGTGPVTRKEVSWRYGQYGLELLDRLEKLLLISKVSRDTYTAGPQSPNLDGKDLKWLGELFVRKHSKPENSEEMSRCSVSFYAEGLNEEGRKLWLSIDTEAFYKKLKIANDPQYKGATRLFTFTATDTIGPDQGENHA